jgi:hypothetical protein
MAAAFWPTQLASLDLFLQLKSLRYWYYGSGTMTLALLDTQLDLLATKAPPLPTPLTSANWCILCMAVGDECLLPPSRGVFSPLTALLLVRCAEAIWTHQIVSSC